MIPTGIDKDSSNKAESSKSDSKTNVDGPKSKLSEVEKLLPYLTLSLDFKVANRAIKCMTKLMLYGKLPLRIALIDQMVYFIKNLMLESTDDF